MGERDKAAVLLSGGMDSATLLWYVNTLGYGEVHTLSFDYGQRHKIELECSALLSRLAGAKAHKVLMVNLSQIGGSPLTDAGFPVPRSSEDRQIQTVVPYRNTIFLALAAAYAETQGIVELFIAPVRDDYRSYRDCRRELYNAMERTLQLGATVDREVAIHTPFIFKWKVEVVALGLTLGVPYEHTHSCYEGTRPACGVCDACAERIAAFRANRVRDPLVYSIPITWES